MLIDKNLMRLVKIEDVSIETPTVKTIFFKDSLSSVSKPGQFLMVWIPRKEELPLSVMISDKKKYAAITIKKNGYGSTSLFNKDIGDRIGIRGPFGNSFSCNKALNNVIFLGGGTGLVPLVRLLYYIKGYDSKFTFIMGAKTKSEIMFTELINEWAKVKKIDLHIATEDGSLGAKGYPTDILRDFLSVHKDIDMIYTCGPELMMKKAYDLATKYSVHMEASIERYMKCGIGICSSCCINDKLVCVDGTIFNEIKIQKLTEFGVSYRNKSGILTKF
ncbi:dihydroorotate dehydrogenase electron transfer subunit [Candidatus Nitrosocosmicus arcticus]|uniref:Oxidoreductase FAD/NAD(P)-binding subunit n=1 Tax=Candidatus Nitrosocosmicus arcticus TaxID=2035267 RepID=A0A557SYD2_9ARCH|nr:dihydroorotate dehydrogenase electron transfer subunit [Candidatus Nitrosocosmicus arcticus]TVP41619.1 Oxidoreductase FAD/NAD(P)-binding subunit [Candidatus Nitrosocosmicus arcticus]